MLISPVAFAGDRFSLRPPLSEVAGTVPVARAALVGTNQEITHDESETT